MRTEERRARERDVPDDRSRAARAGGPRDDRPDRSGDRHVVRPAPGRTRDKTR